MAFALAVLCACGMHQVLSGTVSRRRLVTFGLAGLCDVSRRPGVFPVPGFLAAKAQTNEFYLSLAGAGAVLCLAAVVLFQPVRPGFGFGCRPRSWFYWPRKWQATTFIRFTMF